MNRESSAIRICRSRRTPACSVSPVSARLKAKVCCTSAARATSTGWATVYDRNRKTPSERCAPNFLRYLILGSDGYRSHEKGLRLSGAWITGILDLEGCRIPRDIGLKDCHFEASPVLRSAIIDNLFLDGSVLPGLQADRPSKRAAASPFAAQS